MNQVSAATPLEQQPTTGSFSQTLASYSPYIALLAAWIATSGSLFFSEVLKWQPCLLCWYQRILMYPLSILLAVGILRRDSNMRWYVLPLSLFGAGVSLYHYLLIKTNWLPPPACSLNIPCDVDYINWLGFINIPLLALTAFLIISASMFLSARAPHAEVDEEPRSLLSMENVAVFAIIGIVVLWFVAVSRLM